MSLNFLATRFQCTWPWSTLVMLCDGRLVCGCADPYGHRVLGDARAASLQDVWTGAQNFIEIHADEPSAVKSFGA